METPETRETPWPSAIVALGTIAVLGGIVIAAIVRYDTADEAMTVFAGVWGAIGAGIGLIFAYFFTRGPIKDANDTANKAMEMATKVDTEMRTLGRG